MLIVSSPARYAEYLFAQRPVERGERRFAGLAPTGA
jgi:hypothetical protein